MADQEQINGNNNANNKDDVQVLTSSPWSSDDTTNTCTACNKSFDALLNRRHHCRLCGKIFCNDCSSFRALIPPSSIVLTPKGGKKVSSSQRTGGGQVTFESEEDPDRMVTYAHKAKSNVQKASHPSHLSLSNEAENSILVEEHGEDDDLSFSITGSMGTSTDLSYASTQFASQQIRKSLSQQRQTSMSSITTQQQEGEVLLYGKGLEERTKLAREPLRVCEFCHDQLFYVQEELRACNSNAMRYNAIDPTDIRRLLNSPLAFTLGHEVRKAAYTLNNLLPMPRRLGALEPSYFNDYSNVSGGMNAAGPEQCKEGCVALTGNLQSFDGVKIPAKMLEMAKGVAVMTVIKGGLGFAGFEFGTGLVVSRLGDNRGWSPPCAIGTAGVSWGALIGAQLTDHVFLLMTEDAVDVMSSNDGSFQLGADIGVAVGPLGRALEADIGAAGKVGSGVALAPIYTYSFSKGLYAGVSLDGKVIVTRHRVNEKFYGQQVDARTLLSGEIPTPPAAQPLYDALKRCHVYAAGRGGHLAGGDADHGNTREFSGGEPSDGFSDFRQPPPSAEYSSEEYNIASRDHSRSLPY